MRRLTSNNSFLGLLFFILLFSSILTNNARAQETFEEWKQNYLEEFKEFQNKYDKQFHKMLQQEWKEFSAEHSPDFYETPKPDIIPTVEEESPKPSKATIDLEKIEPANSRTSEKPAPEEEYPQKPSSKQKEQNITNSAVSKSGITPSFEPNVKKAKVQKSKLTFFDIPIQYSYYAAYKKRIDGPIGKKAISDFWKHLSTKDYPSFLKQMQEIRSGISLNDYGYAQLLHNIGNQIYGNNTPESTLFSWFMLTQSGFGTRIAYNKQQVYLLIKVTPEVFKTTYFPIDGSKYYGLNLNGSQSNLPSNLYTYEGSYPKSKEKELSLFFTKRPLLPEQQEQRSFSFTYQDTSYTFELPVDKQVVNYFKNYPKAKLDLYFKSRMDGPTHKNLLNALRPLLEDKNAVEKANLLLSFVQKAFKYQTDQQQFNTEKKMFPAETLYYPASDCDDRTILFSYLIEHLTDLDYIVIRYPGHLTPAVHFPTTQPKGPKVDAPISYEGKEYYVTDPTYINADAGMIMSKYRNTPPAEIFNF
ncbi:hypothetical protein [Fodinibius halophilus]|uniref:Transglutaminase domain-containing protein n=1 Tax=Fodinibius halophilus TaxID=1736908 RepID=A0A6M1T0M5_9BACT|nr:hypothetical protein [Fodinibius halophilus]NGP87537.1 hypothetical protein [Fodinibius halophilus]